VRAEHSPELRARIAAGQEEARSWLAGLFGEVKGTTKTESTRAVGSFHLALLNGLMIQWLVDAERTPSGGDMVEALRRVYRGRRARRAAMTAALGVTDLVPTKLA